MVRYCSYEIDLPYWLSMIEAELLTRKTEPSTPYKGQWGLVDLTWLNETDLCMFSTTQLIKYVTILGHMDTYKPFPLATVHDAFGSHANNCNHVRHWYKEILADLADSEVLSVILNRLYGMNDTYDKYGDIGHLIRQSNYALS